MSVADTTQALFISPETGKRLPVGRRKDTAGALRAPQLRAPFQPTVRPTERCPKARSASQAVYHDGRPPPVRRNPARRAQPPPRRHLLNAAGGRPSQVLGCGLARLPPGVSVMLQRYQSPECAREAGQMSESAGNDRSTRRGAELLHKDSSGVTSAGCPGFPPSGLALPSRYRARTPAARHVLKDERAEADHMGGQRCRLSCVESGPAARSCGPTHACGGAGRR